MVDITSYCKTTSSVENCFDIIENPKLFPDKEDPMRAAKIIPMIPAGGCQLKATLYDAFDMEAKGWKLIDPGSAAGLDGSMCKSCQTGENWFGYYWTPTVLVGRLGLVSHKPDLK